MVGRCGTPQNIIRHMTSAEPASLGRRDKGAVLVKKTDYKAIAENYDKNKYRQEVKQDEDLKGHIDKGLTPAIKVLDLACGTGIYLQNQINYFQDVSIEWHGLDASEEMLQKAKNKISSCRFVSGLAEELPYDSIPLILSSTTMHSTTFAKSLRF